MKDYLGEWDSEEVDLDPEDDPELDEEYSRYVRGCDCSNCMECCGMY